MIDFYYLDCVTPFRTQHTHNLSFRGEKTVASVAVVLQMEYLRIKQNKILIY